MTVGPLAAYGDALGGFGLVEVKSPKRMVVKAGFLPGLGRPRFGQQCRERNVGRDAVGAPYGASFFLDFPLFCSHWLVVVFFCVFSFFFLFLFVSVGGTRDETGFQLAK